MSYNLVGFLFLSFLALMAGLVVSSRPRFPFPQKLLLLALALRVVGSFARYEVLYRFYSGIGDATGYYGSGEALARRIWSFDLSFFGYQQWFGGPDRWWGTDFIRNLSGVTVAAIGPSMRGEFLAFSLLSFLGLYCMALAFWRLARGPRPGRYLVLLWLWPSLWFWPSSVGKEAVAVLAMGLTTLGYAGREGRLRWWLYASGLALAFAVRPHVAAVLILATGAAYWLQSWRRLRPRRVLEGALVLALAASTLSGVRAQFGLEEADLEGVQEFVSFWAQQTLTGGSSIGALPRGAAAVPMAFVNTWMRPFPWEVHNAMALVSAAEILLLWGIAWRRRRSLRLALKHWRRNRLLCFAVPLLIGYTLMIGLTFGNLGIIARQRAPLFPFFFMLLSAAALAVPREARAPVPRPAGRPAVAWRRASGA